MILFYLNGTWYIYGNGAYTMALSDFMCSGVYMELQGTKKT